MGFLLAAGDEDDEFGELLMVPEPEETPEPAPVAPPPKAREWRLGLRAGLFLTGPSKADWDPGFCMGAFYRGAPQKRLVYELGLDYAGIESADGSTASGLMFFRGEALFGTWNSEEKATSFYVLAGAQGISERADLTGSGGAETRMGAGINLGLGMGSVKGTWDVRTVYSVLLGSDNAEGDVLVAAGFSF